MIKLNKKKYSFSETLSEKPVVELTRLSFITKRSNWVDLLSHASLSFELTGIDKNGNDVQRFHDTITFLPFISPNSKEPELRVNKFYTPNKLFTTGSLHQIRSWKIAYELQNLALLPDEEFQIRVMDKKYINSRVNDWKKRIDGLYSEIGKWIKNRSEFHIKEGTEERMHENLMECFNVSATTLPTRDIYHSNRLYLSIKPRNLWVLGANGRIDFLSKKGSFILVDKAEHFQKPDWHLFTPSDKRKGKSFTQEVFLKILTD